MDLRQLRSFAALARERHFGRAASVLRISQPALSQQIKALEASLGVQLFHRAPRGVWLTEAGTSFLGPALRAIEEADRAVESARLAAAGKQGALRIGTPGVGLHRAADALLTEFKRRYPDIQIDLSPAFNLRNLEALDRGEVDVAIVFTPFEPREGLRFMRLESVSFVIAVPEGHRLASFRRIPRAELVREPFLDWPRSINPPLIDHLHRSLFGEVEHPALIEFPEISQLDRALRVAEGQGIAAVLLRAGASINPRGVVFREPEHPVTIDCGVAWREANTSVLVPSFVETAGRVAAEVGRP